MANRTSVWLRRVACPVVYVALLTALVRDVELDRSPAHAVLLPLWPSVGIEAEVEAARRRIKRRIREQLSQAWFDWFMVYVGGDPLEIDTEGEQIARQMFIEHMKEAQIRRSVYDIVCTRILLFILLAALLAPLLLTLIGVGGVLWNVYISRFATASQKLGVNEAFAYYLTATVMAQGLRFHTAAAAGAGENVEGAVLESLPEWSTLALLLVSGVALIRCWLASIEWHSLPPVVEEPDRKGPRQCRLDDLLEFCIGGFMQAAVLGLQASVTGSSLLGFLAVCAAHFASIGLLCWCRQRIFIRRHLAAWGDAAAVVSTGVSVGVACYARYLHSGVRGSSNRQPFAVGAAFFGHLFYFVVIVLLSSRRWKNDEATYRLRQGVVVASIVAALAAGWLLEAPGLSGTGLTFLILWVLMKGFEAEDQTVLQAGVKLAVTLLALRYLRQYSGLFASVLDARNLYDFPRS